MASTPPTAARLARHAETGPLRAVSAIRATPSGGRGARALRDAPAARRAAEFVARGDELRADGRARLAAECYRQAIAYDCTLARAYGGLGSALSAMGRHAEALEQFEKAVALVPSAAAPRARSAR